MDREIEMESVANYDAVAGCFGIDYKHIVPALVKAWDNAPSLELKNSICQTQIVHQVATPTTLSVFYNLTFEGVIITVLKILVAEEYDETGTQENLCVIDDQLLIVGIRPIMVKAND